MNRRKFFAAKLDYQISAFSDERFIFDPFYQKYIELINDKNLSEDEAFDESLKILNVNNKFNLTFLL